jgi:protein-L-isoaspartate(D-aspartate) O-methyltransferase
VSDQQAIVAARNAMVDDLVARRIVQTPAVERAFRSVPRHAFVPEPFTLPVDPLFTELVETDDPTRVYIDNLVVVKREKSINCGTPSVVAAQIELLAPTESMRVLHVGTGSGYYTAILAELAGERGTVLGVEYEPDLVDMSARFLARAGYTNVTVREGDGALGVPEAAPFDRILVSAGAGDIAPAWVSQLGDDGRLVLPFCHRSVLGPSITSGVILAIHKVDNCLSGRLHGPVVFVAMQGALTPASDDPALADALQRWFALEDFLRTDLPIRIVLKSEGVRPPSSGSVPWLLETPSAVMWIQPS